MRILFALTVVLGVATPTLTTTTANGVGHPAYDLGPHHASSQPPGFPTLPADAEIEQYVGDLASLESSDARVDTPAATNVETPAPEAQPVGVDEEPLAVTVPIEQVCEALADAATAEGLPVGFFARLIWQESRFDQWARSAAGALGVAQFMPPTAAEYKLQDPFDPLESVAASARFLRELRDQFGNLGLAAAAYNAGGGRIRKWLNGQSALPQETQNYVQVITGHPAKRWTVQKPLDVSLALPRKAPCDGVEGLSANARAAQHDVRLTDLAVGLIEQAAAAERARVAAARTARQKKYAAARAAKARRLAAVEKSGVVVASASVR